MSVVQTIKDMISVIPDGNANMRGRVYFTVNSDEMMELVPWLNDWNKAKQGKFNGRWRFEPAARPYFTLEFYATGM